MASERAGEEGVQHLGPGVPQVALLLPWCLPPLGLQGTTGDGSPVPGVLAWACSDTPEPRALLAPGPTSFPRVC